MVYIISTVYRVIRTDATTVSTLEESSTPRTNELTVTAKYDYGMFTAIQDIDSIFIIDRNTADVNEAPAFRQLCPVPNKLILVLTDSICHTQNILF
jgi:hypothetical protein